MSDPVLPNQSDVGAMVLQAPEAIWKKIKKQTGAQTREQAATMVQADEKIRELVISLFAERNKNLLTQPASRANLLTEPRSLLTEQTYGAKKAKAVF